MNHEHEQNRTGSTSAELAHFGTDHIEPGQSSRSALLHKSEHAVASGLVQRNGCDVCSTIKHTLIDHDTTGGSLHHAVHQLGKASRREPEQEVGSMPAGDLAMLQMKARDEPGAAAVQRLATEGIAGSVTRLPFLDQIQYSFGSHDVSAVQAHIGGPATAACHSMGAKAYATGNHVAFSEAPDLHTAAHEAAHVVQQRAGVQLTGGVGKVGDEYERNADQVADAVVAGKSAETLLGKAQSDQISGQSGGTARLDGDLQALRKPTFKADSSMMARIGNERAGITPCQRCPNGDCECSRVSEVSEGQRLIAHEVGGRGQIQRATIMMQASRPSPRYQQSPLVRGSCRLRSGAFAWAIVSGAGDRGACFNVQIVFLPGRIEVIGRREGLAPQIGARVNLDDRPIALMQTVAEMHEDWARSPELDVLPNDTDPYYGAQWDHASGSWRDEPRASQGCTLPSASACSDYEGGSRFSRASSYGAVINDSPMVSIGERKDFLTTAVVMETGQPLGSLTWAVGHDGTRAVVGAVRCLELPEASGHDAMLRDYYQESSRSVVDGFAANAASLPPRASATLDACVQRMTSGGYRVVVSGAATPDESDARVLSQHRAESVVTYLTSHGVPRAAISVEAYGATAARQLFGTPGADSANRRVQLTLVPVPE